MTSTEAVAVIDVGKTHVKLLVVTGNGEILAQFRTVSGSRPGPPYRHIDCAAIWDWLLGALRQAAETAEIRAIVPTAFGSTAALIGDDELVLPVLDYEEDPPASVKSTYAKIAPPFAEVCAPTNPGCLTLARQLTWQERDFAEAFRGASAILPFAQYWSWRLSGVAASEVTSLGAQTHLWNPKENRFSSLARARGWNRRFAPLRPAWEPLAPVKPEIAQTTGLPTDCQVLCGIHDSNANYLRYKAAGLTDFTLLSTGTWLIGFNPGFPLERLQEAYDTGSNTDIEGKPVACCRAMAGREAALVAGDAAGKVRARIQDLAALTEQGTLALPSFTESGGPFPGSGEKGRIAGPDPETAGQRAALAGLYAALLSLAAVDLIGGDRGALFLDGGLAAAPLYAEIIASLRPAQAVWVSAEPEGTALGAALLWRWQDRKESPGLRRRCVAPLPLPGLADYAQRWRTAALSQMELPSATTRASGPIG